MGDDRDLVRKTAAQFVANMGENALGYLNRQAKIAAHKGDVISEDAWLDLAAEAKLLISRIPLPQDLSAAATPQKYREQATRLRREARAVNDADLKRQMLDIAAQYVRLAASLEARMKDPR
jgi:hypothetical protein